MKKIKQIVLAGLLLLASFSNTFAQCTVAINSTTSGSAGISSTSVTISHTVSGSNTILLVRASTINADPTSVTWNGSNMTKLATKNNSTIYASIWYMINPASGTHNVVVNGSSGFTPTVGVTSLTGVHQTSPFGTVASANFSGTAPSLAVSSATGELVLDVINVGSFSPTVGSGQTQQYNIANSVYYGAGSSEAGASSVTMSWSIFSPTGTQVAVPVKPCSPVVADAGADIAICNGSGAAIGGSPTASGGTNPYTYAWTPATGLSSTTTANPTASPTSTTTYTVTVTDNASATAKDAVIVTVNALPTASAGSNQSICSGASVSVGGSPTASGGTSPYTYAWSPSTGLSSTTTANPTASPTSTTTYTVTVTDNKGCTKIATATITVNSLTASAGSNQNICNGSSVSIGGSPTASGGTSPYTYVWTPATGLSSTATANPTANPTSTTTYTVTVTDNTGCSKASTASVTVNPLPSASAGSNQTICSGASLSIGGSPTASGGTSPYTYVWTPATGLSSTTTANPTANPTSTTTYTVTLTDNKGCVKAATASITVNPVPTVSAGSNQTICSGSSVSIGGSPTATGGTSPYTYVWTPATGLSSTVTANPTANPASTTTYTVTVTDNAGCSKASTATVTVNALPSANAGIDRTICTDSTVTIGGSPTAAAGTSPYTYAWTPSTGLNSAATANPTANPTSTTTYTVTVTDNNGCIASDAAVITRGTTTVTLASNASGNQVCQGNSIVFTASPSTYKHYVFYKNGTAVQTGTANTYTLTSPTNNDKVTVSVLDSSKITIVPQPCVQINASSSGSANSTATSLTISHTVSGSNTLLFVRVSSNGSDPSSITWNGTAMAKSTGSAVNSQYVSIWYLINPASGTHNVVVNGTAGFAPIAGVSSLAGVNQSSPIGSSNSSNFSGTAPSLTLSSSTSALVLDAVNSTASLSPGAGQTQQYNISGTGFFGAGSSKAGASSVTTTWAGSSYTGVYVVASISALSGCTPTTAVVYTDCPYGKSDTINVTVNPLPTVTVSSNTSICTGSSTSLTSSGATTYAWTPATGLSTTTGTTVSASPTITTTYSVTGTNANGCTNRATVTITVNPLPTVTVSSNASICNGSSTSLTASGATTYAWTPATGLSVTTGATVTASPTTTTTYSVTGTNANGCSNRATVTITVNPLPTVTVTPASASICTGSSTSLTASGATTYAWTPATGLSVTTGATVTANPTTTTTYSVTGTNANGCTNRTTVVITVNPMSTVTVSSNASICSGSSTSLTASGATTYTWTPATGLSATTGATVTASPTSTTTYSVTGTASSCSGMATVTITVNPLPTITVTPASASISSGDNVSLTASGATTYIWIPATGLNATTGSIVTASPTGTVTYTVTGTNANGCANTTNVIVTVTNIIYTVTSTSEGTTTDGVSLRWAITQANTGVGNTVAFNLTGAAPHAFTLITALPVLTQNNTIIDGSTQPANGYTGSAPKIIIDGSNTVSKGLEASSTAGGIKIYGLQIKEFTDYGIYLPGSGNVVGAISKGNVIGSIGNSATDAAIFLKDGTIKNNIIGMNADGLSAQANTGYGIYADGGLVTIGSATDGEGNLISANTNDAIYLNNADNSVIKGNKIGTDATGTTDFGNGGNGISINSGSDGVTIGGNASGEGNIISGNTGNGISMDASNNGIIKGNKIGTDNNEILNVQNDGYGIFITNGSINNQIGGEATNEGNVISHNINSGIAINGATTIKNKIIRNKIYCNAAAIENALGISLINSGNDGMTAPVITAADAASASGTSIANATIEIFKNGNCTGCQGKIYVGTALADNLGNWSFNGSLSENITSTATISDRGTSQFATCVPSMVANAGVDKIICNGASTSIGGAPIVSGGVSPYAYAWTPSGGLNSTTLANPTASPTVTTTYKVIVTDVSGHTASDAVMVTVNPCNSEGCVPGAQALKLLEYMNQITVNTVIGPHGTSSSAPPTAFGNWCTFIGDALCNHVSESNSVSIQVSTINGQSYFKARWVRSHTNTAGISFTCAIEVYHQSSVFTSQVVEYFDIQPDPVRNLQQGNTKAFIVKARLADGSVIQVYGNSTCMNIVCAFDCSQLTANAGTDKTICSGLTTPIGTAAQTGYVYNWSPATGLNCTTCASPVAGPGSTTIYTLTVSSPNCINTSSDQVTVTISNPPVANAAGDDKTICFGSTVQLGTGGQTGNTYNWSPSEGLSCTTCSNPMANPTTTTTYTLIATNPDCGGTVIDEVVITIDNAPIADAGDDKTICFGLSAQLGIAGQTGNTYNWSPATGLSCTTCANPMASPTVTTVYTLAVSGPNCTNTSSDQVEVKVDNRPNANTGDDKTICPGLSAQLGGIAQSGYIYSWSPATGLSCTTCANPIANPSTTLVYSLTVSSTHCANTAFGQVEVKVSNLPTANAGEDKTICQGLRVQIGTAAQNGYIYNWSPSSLDCTSCSNPIASPGVTTVYTLIVSSPNCTNTAFDQVVVTVDELPVANAGGDKTICPGLTTKIGSAYQNGCVYNWSPSTGLNCTNCASPTASPSTTTTYTLTVSSPTCESAATDQVEVKVGNAPNANAGDDKAICSGLSVRIGSASQNGYTYSWSPATGLSCATCSNPIANPVATTVYTLVVSSPNCSGTSSDQVMVTVGDAPIANAGDDKTICPGLTAKIGSAAQSGYTYNWSPSTGLSCASCADPIVNPVTTTIYTLVVSSPTCANTASDQVVINVGNGPSANAGDDKTICPGSNVKIGSVTQSGYLYSWSPSTGLSCVTCADPIANPSTTTVYTLTVSSASCTTISSDQVEVKVSNAPAANAGADQTICPGLTVKIGSTAQSGYTYSWSPSTGLSCANCAGPTANPSITTVYTLTVSSPDCSNSASDQVEVKVGSSPGANAGLDKTICPGLTSVQIGSTAQSGYTYNWSPSTGLSCINCANPIASPTAATTIYTLVVSSPTCTSTASDKVTITHSNSITTISPNQESCFGNEVRLNATGGIIYNWTPISGLSCTDCPNPLASPSSTTSYNVVITDVNACVIGKTVTVVVSPALNVNAGEDITGCIGTAVTLNATGGGTYLWSPEDGLSCVNCPNPNITISRKVTYTVTGFNGNCVAQDQITINPSIENTIDFTFVQTACSVVFTSNVSNLTQYEWDFGDGSAFQTIANPTHPFSKSGKYTICLRVKGICNEFVSVCKTVEIKASDCNCEASNN